MTPKQIEDAKATIQYHKDMAFQASGTKELIEYIEQLEKRLAEAEAALYDICSANCIDSTVRPGHGPLQRAIHKHDALFVEILSKRAARARPEDRS